MKLFYAALIFFSAFSQLSFINAEKLNSRHRDLLRMKRQQANNSPSPPPSPNNPPPPPPSTPNNQPPQPTTTPPFPSVPGAPHTTTTTTASGSGSSSSGSATPNITVISGITITLNATATTPTGPPPLDTGTAIPPLANITLGMATQNPLPVSSTYGPGATPPNSGAPVLPTPCKFLCFL